MPEGEVVGRVWLANNGVHPWMLYLEVEELVLKQPNGDTRQRQITDHGMFQSSLCVAAQPRKLGIQLIYGMEANIVEDRCSIVHNEVEMGSF